MTTAEERVAAGVSRTALMVAAARAIESNRDDALAVDGYAEHFVRALPDTEGWPLRIEDVADGDADPLWGRLARYFGLRTRVFDDHLTRVARAGTRQFVLLGAGLDTRALRLDWPGGCTVFEVDHEHVLAFKQRVLDGLGASGGAARAPVAADLRGTWTPRLVEAGFDPAAPTAWLAEGIFMFLSHTAERRLVRELDRLSAPGSGLAFEFKAFPADGAPVRTGPLYTVARKRIGVDLLSLFNPDPRPDSATDLAARGWTATSRAPFEFTREHGRGPTPEPDDPLEDNRWIFAEKRGGWA